MNEREWLKKAFERRQYYGRENAMSSAWNLLVSTIQSHLDNYRAHDRSSRLSLQAEGEKLVIGCVTIRRNLEKRTIEIFGLGAAGMEVLPVPVNGVSLEKLVQRILEPVLFPETTVVVAFR